MFEFLCVLVAVCLLFGVGYPVAAIMAYPVYKKFGGDMSLREYISLL